MLKYGKGMLNKRWVDYRKEKIEKREVQHDFLTQESRPVLLAFPKFKNLRTIIFSKVLNFGKDC